MAKRFYVVYVLMLAAAIVSAFLFGRSFSRPVAPSSSSLMAAAVSNAGKEIRSLGYQYINPLLDCNPSEADFSEVKSFKQDLQDLVNKEEADGNPTFVSAYFRDMNNGASVGINQDATFSPASLLKVPLMIAYYKLAETKPGILDEKIKVTTLAQLVPNEQIIKPQQQLKIGKTYSVSELIDHMIRYSDNDATQLLITHVNLGTLALVYKDFGLSLPTSDQPAIYVTVSQYAGFFRLLFNGSYLTQSASEKAMETLVNVDYKDGLVAGVPGNINVAHKFGERLADNQLTQVHDCGIVYYPKHPYLLCVMTRGQDEQALSKVIKNISSLVYQRVSFQVGTK